MSAIVPETEPPCASECIARIRQHWEDACEKEGVPIAEVHITSVPLLVPTDYEDLECECPHGVVWHVQPTSEQIAQWVEDGVA